MSDSLILFLLEAMLINYPLMTALWADQSKEGDIPSVEVCVKYSSNCMVICCVIEGSVSSESFRRQLKGVGAKPM